MVLVSVSIHEARVSSTFFGGLKASRSWKLKKIIILENIESNELSLVFSKIVSKGLCWDKVWGISILPSCTPIRGIYRKSLLKGWVTRHQIYHQDLLECKVNLSNTKNPAWFFILASLLDRGMERVNWLPPRTIVCFRKLYFVAVQLSIVSRKELLERLWIKLIKLRWWATGLFCLGMNHFG